MVKEIRGRSGAGSVPVHGLAPQNLSPDKHVDVCADGDEDRGSTPLASSPSLWSVVEKRRLPAGICEGGLSCICVVPLQRLRLAGQHMPHFFYVYELVSQRDESIRYRGITRDLRRGFESTTRVALFIRQNIGRGISKSQSRSGRKTKLA